MVELASKPKSHQTTVLEAALDYHQRGWAVIDLDYRSKAIREPDWPRLVLDEEGLHKRLTGANRNIAIILGDRSDGLIDIDLDSPEALKLAEQFLPPTEAIFGRKSKPKSHYLYKVKAPLKTTKFDDVDSRMLVEIRSSGCATVFPPSLHESNERVVWSKNGDSAYIGAEDLNKAVRRLACAALLARHWPKKKGKRQDAAMALAGCLLRADFFAEEASKFITSVAQCAGDEEAEKRGKVIDHTERRRLCEESTHGWPTLAKIFGDSVIDKHRTWLGLWDDTLAEATEDNSFTANELMRMVLPPISWIVPEMLPKGLVIFAGPPKAGKSWLGLHMAVETALGGRFLSDRDITQRPVLCIALEDSESRLQDRLSIVLGGRKPPDTLRFLTYLPPLDKGGFDRLVERLEVEPKPELVIIDTFGRIAPTAKRGSNPYLDDYVNIGRLQRLAIEKDICLVLIHHLRKSAPGADPDDVVSEVSGTTGITAAPDTIWVLRALPRCGLELRMTGRDIEQQEFGIAASHDTGFWSITGKVEDHLRDVSPERADIIRILTESVSPLGPEEIAGRCDSNSAAVRKLLRKMKEDGQVLQPKTGQYTVHNSHTDHSNHNGHSSHSMEKLCNMTF